MKFAIEVSQHMVGLVFFWEFHCVHGVKILNEIPRNVTIQVCKKGGRISINVQNLCELCDYTCDFKLMQALLSVITGV